MQQLAPRRVDSDAVEGEPRRSCTQDAGPPNGALVKSVSLDATGPIWTVELTDADRISAHEALDEHLMGRPEGELDTPEFFDAAEVLEGVLPASGRAAFAALRAGSVDAVLVRGLPQDRVPGQTPKQRNEAVARPLHGHAWIAIAVRRLGHEYAYALEKGGAVVQNIHPTGEGAETQSNASWKVDLCLHTENAFHPIRPDFVVLYCVRAPTPPPATRLAFIDDVIRRLTDHEAAILRQERFTVDVVESFRCEGASALSLPLRVLGGATRRQTVRWHESLRPGDDAATGAWEAFAEAAAASVCDVRLAPGDLLAFANDRCLHGRASFDARLDGQDRWLLRSYALRDRTRVATYLAPDRPRVMRFDLRAASGA
jgi:L-asparagine oxygenase